MGTYLVTGGAGFIGSHVVDALIADGHSVRVLDDLSSGNRDNLHKDANFIEGDIANAETVRRAMHGCDGVVHLAAIASVQKCRDAWAESHRTNVLGSTIIFDEAARSVPSPTVVYASSAATYGDNPNIPLAETETPAPLTSYGLDKWSNEQYAAMAHKHYGLHSFGLRFFNVYGPRQDPASPYSGVISLFANAAKNDTGITLFGDGLQSRDFIHVSDLVRLILSALQYASKHSGAHVGNGCTGNQTSLLTLIEALRHIHQVALPVTHEDAREGDIKHSCGNPHAMRELLGFEASTPLEDGLRTLA